MVTVMAAVDLSKLPAPATRQIDFTKDVQPLFEASCWKCHGPQRTEGGLRLDQHAAALKGGERGSDIVPGKSAESLLIHAVSHLDPELKMPRKGERLTTEQVGILRAWIDQGAAMPEKIASAKDPGQHWAFKAPVKPKVPVMSQEVISKSVVSNQSKEAATTGSPITDSLTTDYSNPIDAFVAARLLKEGLAFSRPAEQVTLLRRLHLDLIGLPPTIAEVDAFLGDKSKDAYGKVIEKLLASPHYGERWGRHWLDAARYADSDGYEKDMSREMWPYRDYVVNAFNRDLPYNQFIVEQIAGDQLPDATQDQIVATGFLRNSMVNMEGAIDPEQFRMEGLFDRMDCVGKAVLGLTIQCAQCHTHKFDPISHEEYYQLFAYLNNDHETRPAVYSLEQQKIVAGIRKEIAGIEKNLQQRAPDWQKQMAAWEDSVKSNQPEWIVITNLVPEGDKSQRYLEQQDGSLLAAGYAPTKFTQHFRVTNDLNGVTAFQLELLTDPNLPFEGPGRSFNGTCALSEFTVESRDAKTGTNSSKIKFAGVTSDFDQPQRALENNFDDRTTNSRVTGPVKFALDGNDKTAWGIDAGPGLRNQDRKAVFVCEKPAGIGASA